MQDLANGHLDVKALGEAANGDENTIVTTRTGNTYPSAERAINIMFQNGGLPAMPFQTKALMTASALVDGDYAQITDDTVNNGLYVKTAGVWVKSGYDPLMQSKSYTDSYRVVDKFKKPSSVYTSTVYGKTTAVSATSSAPLLTTGVMFLSSLATDAIVQSLTVYASLATQVKVAEVTANTAGGYNVVQISESTSVGVGVTTIMLQTPITVKKDSYLVILSSVSKSLWFRADSPADNGGYIGLTWDYDTTAVGGTVTASGSVAAPNYRLEASIALQSEVIKEAATLSDTTYVTENTLNSLLTSKYLGEPSTPITGGVDATLTSAVIAQPISGSGTISYTEFYASRAGFLHLIVMEKLSDTQYKVINVSEKINVANAGLKQVSLSTALQVKAGQYVGWYQSVKIVKWVQKSGNPVQAVGFTDDTSVIGGVVSPATALNPDYRAQIKIKVSSLEAGFKLVTLTQAEYDALSVKDPNTMYAVV